LLEFPKRRGRQPREYFIRLEEIKNKYELEEAKQPKISQNLPNEETKEGPILHSVIQNENMKNEIVET
jgi:hypothetical protein